ncbi:MAG TPA: cytochrome c biogenesis protein/redoxin [Chloroflexia bacterium]|nr:cytochrome c biogenesis protein/redoxin [Chloroflexia bacterium]
MVVLLLFAFVAGILTILSPCILPVVPLILGTAAGGGQRRPLGIILGLALSFTLFSVVLAATLDALGLTTYTLRLIAVAALAAFGVALLVPAVGAQLETLLAPLARFGARAQGPVRTRGDFAGGLVIGAGLGLIWAPCAGPIMGTVIVLAATGGVTPATALVALAYALGSGVPLLAIGYGGRALARRTSRVTRGGGLQRGFGALMLLTCVAILAGWDIPVQTALADALPAGWTNTLYSIEEQAPVQQELQYLKDPSRAALSVPAAGAPAAAAATPTPAALLPPSVAAHLPAQVALENLGPAPELTGITEWVNTPPVRLQELRGKVVLVHFWTFACINCIHVQPYVKDWYARYKDAGFTVVGVHTPELSFEKEIANVRASVQKTSVLFPVAFDPQYATWNAYHNRYWPAFYFIDKQGQIRRTHAGEGDYEGSEQVIRQLLLEQGPAGN